MSDSRDTQALVPRIIAAAGGMAAVAQVALPWEQLGGMSGAPSGLGLAWNGADANGGKLILVIGVIVLLMAVARAWQGRGVPSAVLALGVAVTAIGVANFLSIKRDADDWNAMLDTMQGAQGALLSLGFRMEIGLGVYLAIAGGFLISLGGAMSLAMTRSNSALSNSGPDGSLRAVSGRLAVGLAGEGAGAPAPPSGKAPEEEQPNAEQ